MNKKEIETLVLEAITVETGMPAESITMDKTMDALDIDSLSSMTIMVDASNKIEKLTGKRLPLVDVIPRESTIGETISAIEEMLA